MQKHVAVLMGGWSAEREISLRSGKACADALERTGYRVSRIDVDREIAVPTELVSRVQHGVAAERAASADARLDRLLDRDVVEAPAGLAQRVIAALESARRIERIDQSESARGPRFVLRTRWVYAAAATILAALIAWFVWTKRSEPKALVAQATPRVEHATTGNPTQPDDQMLAALPALENWERLGQVDVLLSTLEPTDEALLEYQETEPAPPPVPPTKDPEPHSPGTHSKG